jgi:hypothetical protein
MTTVIHVQIAIGNLKPFRLADGDASENGFALFGLMH